MKPWRRPESDKVTPELRRDVINRDRRCQIAAYDPAHVCHNEWGDVHDSTDVGQLTYEHVKKNHRTGKRATSRIELAVATCHGGNVGVPSAIIREKWRDRLRLLYPTFWEDPNAY